MELPWPKLVDGIGEINVQKRFWKKFQCKAYPPTKMEYHHQRREMEKDIEAVHPMMMMDWFH